MLPFIPALLPTENTEDVGDSIEGIADANSELMRLSSQGGGVGIGLSRIRGRGKSIKDNGGFKEAFQEPDGMPEFGNADILAELERLSGEPEKPVRKTRVSKAPVKKPRTPRSKK